MKLTFNKTTIWPDKSLVDWCYDGKGYITKNGKKSVLTFIIRTNNTSVGYSSFVDVIDKNNDSIICSPIFWDIMEWSKTDQTLFHTQFHRQAAMQWAEDYYVNNILNEKIPV